MIIETKSARSFLQIGGEKPIDKTVDIYDFDGFSGVAGEGADGAEVPLANNACVIAGNVEASDPEIPARRERWPSGLKPLPKETAPPYSKRHGGALSLSRRRGRSC